ncbi:SAM-dependent methyltransferase [Dermacoccus nishinomiyaensis]|uniref:SAM-dependent methyltransferase n=1 Tax=Dermacoccus nishinomiyaensis TaxID=1274 RepID=UPI00248D63D9|nr:SAM-dependent methyltransferase [Dermacoccus nishinomiyaensis]
MIELPVLFSTTPDYYRFAVVELRRELDIEKVTRVGEDAGLVQLKDGGLERIHDLATSGYLRFCKYLANVEAHTPTKAHRHDDVEEIAEWALDAMTTRLEALTEAGQYRAGDAVSLHTWDSGQAPWAPGKVRRPLLEMLMDEGVRVVPGGAEHTLSLCLGEDRLTTGVTPTHLGLSDWAGGRIRLAARKEQVSRAEFKLEELFGLIDVPRGDVAVDLGASPGGWTRILRSHGFAQVHAVDPADIDERVMNLGGVEHHKTTAGEFVAKHGERVDLIVNDMRMPPQLSAHTMLEASDMLRPGGSAIVTLKLGTNNPVKQADEAMTMLTKAYDITFARQLQHNRHEITLVLSHV